jgi:hypothetical protein
MLLGFYDWPKIETSAVLTASIRNTIQSDNFNTTAGAPSVLAMEDSINGSLKDVNVNV